MRLSIITCTYNSEKYLPQCLESVLSQNINPDEYEHIIVDGNSTDKTITILELYKVDNPQYHITIIKKNPKWVYNAMNEGIKIAKGAYVIFLNSDDYWKQGVMLNYIKYIQKTHDQDVYYARFCVRSNDIITWTAPFSNILLYQIQRLLFFLWFNTLVYHPTTIIKKSLFDELWLYDETKKIASDYGFWLACIKAKKKFTYYPHITSNFRMHIWSLTSNNSNRGIWIDEEYQFRKKYFWRWWICVHTLNNIVFSLYHRYTSMNIAKSYKKYIHNCFVLTYLYVNKFLWFFWIELKRKHSNQHKRLQNMDIDTVVDIWANIWQFLSEYQRILPKAKFHSFEPLPTAWMKLKENHGNKKNVTIYNVWLGKTQGTIEMNESDYDTSSSMLEMTELHKEAYPHTQWWHKAKVEVKTLDSLDITGNTMLIKIDTQWYEDQIIAGWQETIKKAKVCIIETSFYPLYVGQPLFSDIYAMMIELWFMYYWWLEQGMDPKDGKCLFQDSVFIKKE